MSNAKLLTPSNVPQLRYKGKPVVTTATLAELYGTKTIRIQQNHSKNRDRFVDGKHCFKVSGFELANLRLASNESQIPAKARSAMLWTERGAARHAKMLETNEAWDVFEALEDHYFGSPMQKLEEALAALELQKQCGSKAGRELNRHKHEKPKCESEVRRCIEEAQLSLPFPYIVAAKGVLQ